MNNSLLKTETQDLHDRIEHVMHAHLLFSNQFTEIHYQHFMLKSYRYIHAIVDKVSMAWPEFSEILEQKRLALREDLAHLQLTPDESAALAITSTDKHYKLGLIYIVLGAMLGNKMILSKLKEYPAFEGFPFAYLSRHQDQLSSIWKDFQSRINQLDAAALQHVIQGARDGYLFFGE